MKISEAMMIVLKTSPEFVEGLMDKCKTVQDVEILDELMGDENCGNFELDE